MSLAWLLFQTETRLKSELSPDWEDKWNGRVGRYAQHNLCIWIWCSWCGGTLVNIGMIAVPGSDIWHEFMDEGIPLGGRGTCSPFCRDLTMSWIWWEWSRVYVDYNHWILRQAWFWKYYLKYTKVGWSFHLVLSVPASWIIQIEIVKMHLEVSLSQISNSNIVHKATYSS